MRFNIGSTLQQTIDVPFPLNVSSAKINVDREQSRIDYTAPVADIPFLAARPDNIFPLDMHRCDPGSSSYSKCRLTYATVQRLCSNTLRMSFRKLCRCSIPILLIGWNGIQHTPLLCLLLSTSSMKISGLTASSLCLASLALRITCIAFSCIHADSATMRSQNASIWTYLPAWYVRYSWTPSVWTFLIRPFSSTPLSLLLKLAVVATTLSPSYAHCVATPCDVSSMKMRQFFGDIFSQPSLSVAGHGTTRAHVSIG